MSFITVGANGRFLPFCAVIGWNMIFEIDSINNPKIKRACKLASSSKERKQSGLFFLEGLRLCFDASQGETEISEVYFTDKAYEKSTQIIEAIIKKSENAYRISQAVSSKLSQTQTSQGVFCVCKIKEKKEMPLSAKKKYIALDGVANPDNLGAVCRTAEALGIEAIITGGGCDIYNPKALRASMGSLLRLSVIRTEDLALTLSALKEKGFKVYATTPDSSAQSITQADMSAGTVAVIGNEANGVSDEVFAVCEKITIPMLGRAESLNAGMAAAITIWEMMRS